MKYAEYIDYTNLKPDATIENITKLCEEAKIYHTQSVCVNPYYVSLAKELLEGTTTTVTTVIGFPLGANKTRVKEMEAIVALEDGADEIDMVINISALKNKDYDYIKEEINDIMAAVDGKTLKVIIETSLLTEEEIIKMTQICNDTFVNYIKTSTGFGKRGVSLDDIDIINAHKNEILEIKASGGIKSEEMIEELLNKGVTRLGISDTTFLKGENKWIYTKN